MKKYRLLKDFLDGKAGDIYEQRNIRPSEYENITRSGRDCLQAIVVERYPDWFEEATVDPLVKYARNFYKEREDNAKKEPEYIFWNDKKYEVENRTGDISKPERMIIREVKEEEPNSIIKGLAKKILIWFIANRISFNKEVFNDKAFEESLIKCLTEIEGKPVEKEIGKFDHLHSKITSWYWGKIAHQDASKIAKQAVQLLNELYEQGHLIITPQDVVNKHYKQSQNSWSDKDMIEFAKLISFKGLNPALYRSVENDYRHINEKYKELLKCMTL